MAKTKRTCDQSTRTKRRSTEAIQQEYINIITNERALLKILKNESFLSFEEYHEYLIGNGYILHSREYLNKINEYLSVGVL